MYSLIYLTEDIKDLDNKSVHLILGGNKWKVLQDKNNCFSIGDEIIYNYKKTGIYKFLFKFNFYSNNFYYNPIELKFRGIYEQILTDRSLRSNYYNHLLGIIKAEAGMQTNFELNITNDTDWMPEPLNIKGDNYNYSLTFIEVQYIDEDESESLEPIIITEDTELSLNRRYIVKAPLLKTIALSINDNIKIGDWIEIKNMDLGNFQINSGENIDIMINGIITKSKKGYIRSKKRGDFLRLECMEISPRIIFSDTNTIGTFTVSLF